MTICIGVICDDAQNVVLATDKMITVHPLSQEFEHGTPKTVMLCDSCVALSAGSALLPTEVFNGIRPEVSSVREPSVKDIVEKVKERYVNARKKKVEEELLRPRGFTIATFYERISTLPPQIALPLDNKIQEYDGFSLELIITGVDSAGAHIFTIEDPGTSACFDSLGYACIGSGEPHAFASFIANDYTPMVKGNEALYLTYEAKKRAEKAPGVGPSTDMLVISKSGVQTVTQETMQTLEKIYQLKVSLEKERSEEINALLGKLKI